MKKEEIVLLENEFETLTAEDVLTRALSIFGNKIAFASSLSKEDQVITHMLVAVNPHARIFVLDTGRLPQETYDVMADTREKYGINFEVCFPERIDVEQVESIKGPNAFYESLENRKECCFVRKVKPLKRKLQTVDAWITGLRRTQSITRIALHKIEWDETFQKVKFNPLADWDAERVSEYIKKHEVPYNILHNQGYPSIGCAPCTRAIKPGEDERAGRWWWEEPEKKECGLHLKNGS